MSPRKEIALMIHLTEPPDKALWGAYSRNLEASKLSFDIYVNCRSSEIAAAVIRTFGLKVRISIDETNKGMDLGGFFMSVLTARKACLEYDFAVKLHGKQEVAWMRKLSDPLVGSAAAIQHLSQVLKREEVGQVFASSVIHVPKKVFPDRLFLSNSVSVDQNFFDLTAPVEDGILDSLGLSLKRSDRFFMAGTMLGLKWQVLQRALPSHTIQSVLQALNSPRTYDVNWFALMSRNSAHEPHLNLPGNSLLAHHSPGYMPDGQVEHGWERVLCYLAPALGYETMLVGARYHEEQFMSEWLTVTTRRSCMDEESGTCLRDAAAGECLLTPAYMLSNCKFACICLHGEHGYADVQALSTDLFYFYNVLQRSRLKGPFKFVADAYQNIIECVEGGFHAEFAKDTLLHSPVTISKDTRISSCSRVLSLHSGNQLHLGRDGILRLQDRSYRLIWSSSTTILPTPREERSFILQIINTKRTSARLTIQNAATGEVVWQSSTFLHSARQSARLVVEDDEPCVRLFNSHGEIWAQCE